MPSAAVLAAGWSLAVVAVLLPSACSEDSEPLAQATPTPTFTPTSTTSPRSPECGRNSFEATDVPAGWSEIPARGPGGGAADNPGLIAHWWDGEADGVFVDLVRGDGGYVVNATEELTVLDQPASGGRIHDGFGVRFTACGETFQLQGYGISGGQLYDLAESLRLRD